MARSHDTGESLDEEIEKVVGESGCAPLQFYNNNNKKYNTRSLIKILDDSTKRTSNYLNSEERLNSSMGHIKNNKNPTAVNRPKTSLGEPISSKYTITATNKDVNTEKRTLFSECSVNGTKRPKLIARTDLNTMTVKTKTITHEPSARKAKNKAKEIIQSYTNSNDDIRGSKKNTFTENKEEPTKIVKSISNTTLVPIPSIVPNIIIKEEIIDLTEDDDYHYVRINYASNGMIPSFDTVIPLHSEFMVSAKIGIVESKIWNAEVFVADIRTSVTTYNNTSVMCIENDALTSEERLAHNMHPFILKYMKLKQAHQFLRQGFDTIKSIYGNEDIFQRPLDKIGSHINATASELFTTVCTLVLKEFIDFHAVTELITDQLHLHDIHSTPSAICLELNEMFDGRVASEITESGKQMLEHIRTENDLLKTVIQFEELFSKEQLAQLSDQISQYLQVINLGSLT